MESSGISQQHQTPSRQLVVSMSVVIAVILSAAVLALNAIDQSASVVLDSSGVIEDDPSESLLPPTGLPTPTLSSTPTAPDGEQPIPTAEPGEIEPAPPPVPEAETAPTPSQPPDIAAPELPDPVSATDQPAAPPADAVPAPEPEADVPADSSTAIPGDPADDSPQPLGNPVLAVGTCLVNTDQPTNVASVTPASCDSEHTGEVYVSAVLPLGPGAAYPGQESLNDQTQLLCQGAAYGQYVGRDFNDGSRFFVNGLFPTEQSWGAGDRDTACYLYDLAGPRTGSARGSGL